MNNDYSAQLKKILAHVVNKDKVSLEKKSTWLLEMKDAKYILKLASHEKNRSVARRIFSSFYPDSAKYFENELNVYKGIMKNQYKSFKYPKLIEYNKKEFILLEYIPSKKGWNEDKISKAKFVDCLYEFNSSGGSFLEKDKGKFNTLTFQILFLSLFRIWKVVSFRDSMRAVLLVLRKVKLQRKINKQFLLHNDLFGSNNILSSGNELFFLDFESTGLENRWILKDIIEMSLKRDLSFDGELFKKYLEKIDLNNHLDVETQLRIIILFRTIKMILSDYEGNKFYKEKHIAFFREILLSDSKFEEWLIENGIINYS